VYNFLLFEPIHEAGIEVLESVGTIRMASATDEDTLIDEIADIDGVVIRANGRVTRRLLAHGPRLKVVGRHGVGVDNVDLDAATDHGVQVVNTPLATVEPVAEHAIALMLALSKQLLVGDRLARAGQFAARLSVRGFEMAGKTLGVVGFGRIGRRVAQIAHHGLGMRILYSDVVPAPDMEQEIAAQRAETDALLAESDYVTVHVPLLPQTTRLIGADQLARMKSTAFFVNTSRGPVVDEVALCAALQEKRIAGAGIDVFEEEPAPGDNPLFALDNIVVTPHIASSTGEALRKMALVAEDVVAVVQGRTPAFPVNTLR